MVDDLKLIIKQIILNMKYLLGNTVQVLMLIFVILIITLILPTVLFTIWDIYGLLVAMPIVICLFSIYSSMVGQYRKSTLYSNARTTKMNRWIYNLSSLFTMIIVGYLVFFFQLAVLILMGHLNFLPMHMFNDQGGYYVDFGTLTYSWVLYWVGLIILITYSISFSLYRFISSANTFFIFALTIVLLMIVFGAVLNDYFQGMLPANGITNNIDNIFLAFYVEDNLSMYPNSMYFVSLLYPFYATNQMLNICGQYVYHSSADGSFWWWQAPGYNVWDWQTSADYAWNGLKDQSWRFNILYFVPYIQSISWIGFGLLISKFKVKWKS